MAGSFKIVEYVYRAQNDTLIFSGIDRRFNPPQHIQVKIVNPDTELLLLIMHAYDKRYATEEFDISFIGSSMM